MQFHKRHRAAFVNFLRAKVARINGDPVVDADPYHILIDPSSCCPLRCAMCVDPENPGRRLRPPVIMSPALYESMLDELGENLFMLSLYNWGEPLLNPDLARFIERAKRDDIFVDINTNLALKLDDADLESLLRSGVDNIVVSIDGFSQESYGTYRIGGSFDLARENITRLAALRDRIRPSAAITWKFLVFRFNEHEINPAERYCRDLGVAFARKEAIIDLDVHPEWLPSHRLDDRGRPHGGWPFRRSVPPELKAAGREATCAWHYCYSCVNADGSVSPCCAVAEPENDFGNVVPGEIPFADVWNGEPFRKSRAILAGRREGERSGPDPFCARCPFPFLKDLSTGIDSFIISRFQAIHAAADPCLAGAFARLAGGDGFREYVAANPSLWDVPVPARKNAPPPPAHRGAAIPRVICGRGTCAVCGAETDFTLKRAGFSLRETACGSCGSSRRNRDLAAGILETYGLDPSGSLASHLPALSRLAIFEAQADGPVHRVLRHLPGYRSAEFLDGVPRGASNAAGIRCEDLERLTFPGGSFDLVITQDVFEHVARPEAAFREIARILKPGGCHLFTVPLHEGRATRTRVRPAGDGVEHLVPPVYHGDPLRSSGSLVFTDFGDDLPALLEPLGFATGTICRETFYSPGEIPWIDGPESHARYMEFRRRGELLSCLRYNSVVFRSVRRAPDPECSPGDPSARDRAEGETSLRFREAMEILVHEPVGVNDLVLAGEICRLAGEIALSEKFFAKACAPPVVPSRNNRSPR